MTVARPVLLLDLDDTLVPDVPAARRAIADTLRGCALPDTVAAVDTVLAAVREAWRAEPGREHPELAQVSSWEALWVDFAGLEVPARLREHDRRAWRLALSRLSAAAPSADRVADRMAVLFRARRAELTRPLPGVPGRLAELAARHDLWLVTQGCRTLQRRKVELAGLTPFFARIFVTAELGFAKDDPRFAAALRAELAGRPVHLLVGDSARTDLALAETGGWPAVHLCDPSTCQEISRPTVRHAPDFTSATAQCAQYAHCAH
ncbi:HAD family hydrolase [Kitasatospora viridis]|uniref:FMN phosphatase YigB (HAD superfamily) n=1 Tax=Kitasatospora viridis TaxID=281105 RepID=A0A561UQH6_9ACTN|nr:HAD family hydrolase [Kitasatospora viridis]TWG01608.1 FMN phosphatase YigB (HAD superfamily) [Kitasatospora viridis]